MTVVHTFYGTEKVSQDVQDMLDDRGLTARLFNHGAEEAASAFVDTALQLAYLANSDEAYFMNIGALCLDVAARHKGFAEKLQREVRALSCEDVPSRALILYGLV